MKKRTLGMLVWSLSICLAAFTLAACGEPDSGPTPPPPPEPATKKLTLAGLSAQYQGDPTNLITFSANKTNFPVNTEAGKPAINLAIKPPENAYVELDTTTIKKFKVDSTSSAWEENGTTEVTQESLSSLPVPALDPVFNPDASVGEEGYGSYQIKFKLKLKAEAAKTGGSGDDTWVWEENQYTVRILEQAPENVEINAAMQQKINDRIDAALNELNSFDIYVGNPASTEVGGDNDPRIVYINDTIDELNKLKEGETEYRTYETTTKPDAVAGTEVASETALESLNGAGWCEFGQTDGGQTIYLVKEAYQVYNPVAILVQTKTLTLAIEDCRASGITKLVMGKIRFDYLSAEQAGAENPERIQNAQIASKGKYDIELVGGSGGHVWTGTNKTTTGGRGARVIGNFTFDPAKGQAKLGFRVGGEGDGTAVVNASNQYVRRYSEKQANDTWEFTGGGAASIVDYHGTEMQRQEAFRAEKPGGWPNGGSGGWTTRVIWAPGSGGGGSSDVRIYSGDTLSSLFTYNESDPRILVAGGGGGAGQISGGTAAAKYTAVMGGNGGDAALKDGIAGGDGVAGYNGAIFAVVYRPKIGQATESGPTDKGIDGKPGFNANGSGTSGTESFPVADSGTGHRGGFDGEGRGGGGGGFIGGEAIDIYQYKGATNYGVTGSGAGGSNHIDKSGASKVSTVYDRFGPGYAVITWKSK